jgi:hypothetical protein
LKSTNTSKQPTLAAFTHCTLSRQYSPHYHNTDAFPSLSSHTHTSNKTPPSPPYNQESSVTIFQSTSLPSPLEKQRRERTYLITPHLFRNIPQDFNNLRPQSFTLVFRRNGNIFNMTLFAEIIETTPPHAASAYLHSISTDKKQETISLQFTLHDQSPSPYNLF